MRLLAVSILCLLGPATLASGQEIQVTWGTQKTLDRYPSEVNGKIVVGVSVNDVNDYLYTYTQALQAIPRVISDASQIFNVGAAAPSPSDDDCSVTGAAAAVKAIESAFASNSQLNPLIKADGKTPASPPRSIAVGDTQSAYRSIIAPQTVVIEQIIVAKAKGDCRALYKEYQAFEPHLTRMRTFDASNHIATGTATLYADNDYQLTITESYEGAQTDGGYKQFKFSPQSHTLTLSAGVGLTTIQSRSYTVTAVPAPVGSSTPTQNVLSVGDKGAPRPIALGLLNYDLGSFHGNYLSRFSLALSSGPVIQGSGKSDLQPVGFFGGVSLSLFHRLFLTPGVHIGQFADLPAGFTAGQVVPSGIGSPTATKRWTARFSFGVTYKAASLGTPKVSATDTTATAKATTTPKTPADGASAPPVKSPANTGAPKS